MKDLISPIISDSMIIQMGMPFPIWSKKKLSVAFLDKTYESSKADGKWLLTLDPLKAGGPFEMRIKCGNESVVIKDIYSGDVWLCSGQSNMEMQMTRLRDDFSEEWEGLERSDEENNSSLLTPHSSLLIRQFKVPQEWDFSGPRDELAGGSWLKLSYETLSEFAAAPWFFAKSLCVKYKIPIGLISTAWGGTPVESWMSEDALFAYPDKIAEGKKYADTAKIKETVSVSQSAIQNWETNLSRDDKGIAQQWQNPETDISSWRDITLPGNFNSVSQNDPEMEKFTGVIWLSKEFEADSGFAQKQVKIWLGTITDADTVYLNGAEIGKTTYRYPPRKYIVKASPNGSIKQGKNRIVIRVVCNSGDGGITADKPFCVLTENESKELSGLWKYKIGAAASPRPGEFFFQRLPIGNFNAIISPVLKFPLKGVIWYQGESNDLNADEYEKLFASMIQDWRKKYQKNNNSSLPFLFVQLPVFGALSDNNEKHHWAVIREAQAKTLSLPLTGMAAALELGEWNDIHPINKKDIGCRLFLAADKLLFGAENNSPGPLLREIKSEKLGVRSDGKILIFFDNCGEGIVINEKSDEMTAYVSVVSDAGQSRHPVTIEGKNIISIDISGLKNPRKILYAWANNPRDRQLFNSDDLPMLPFKIELNKGE